MVNDKEIFRGVLLKRIKPPKIVSKMQKNGLLWQKLWIFVTKMLEKAVLKRAFLCSFKTILYCRFKTTSMRNFWNEFWGIVAVSKLSNSKVLKPWYICVSKRFKTALKLQPAREKNLYIFVILSPFLPFWKRKKMKYWN